MPSSSSFFRLPISYFLSFFYFKGWIWSEIKSLWSDGLGEYVSDLWNVVDFITNTLYVTWIALRGTAVFCVMVCQQD